MSESYSVPCMAELVFSTHAHWAVTCNEDSRVGKDNSQQRTAYLFQDLKCFKSCFQLIPPVLFSFRSGASSFFELASLYPNVMKTKEGVLYYYSRNRIYFSYILAIHKARIPAANITKIIIISYDFNCWCHACCMDDQLWWRRGVIRSSCFRMHLST
jgi:hypothetical protein